ncbi:MAG: NlpC/P60 family protein [Bacteroidales bacterium]|nr:NlpC/P60 family protein [Bacteroidales bacterium]
MFKVNLIKSFFFSALIIIISCAPANKTTKTRREIKDEIFVKTYSEKLNIKLNGSENKLLISTIADWLGVPHKLGGCTKQGTDCSCLVQNIYKTVYKKDVNRQTADIYDKDINVIKKSDLKEGDLVFFRIASKKPDHVGIYIKDGYFVHTSSKKGVMVSNLNEDYFHKYFYCAGRVK